MEVNIEIERRSKALAILQCTPGKSHTHDLIAVVQTVRRRSRPRPASAEPNSQTAAGTGTKAAIVASNRVEPRRIVGVLPFHSQREIKDNASLEDLFKT